jgi:hypothetical protein
MRALVVSYLGDSITRRQAHQEQINWLFDNGISEVWCNYKGYESSDFDSRVSYFPRQTTDSIIQPATARNELLEHWYQTDDDWCIIADNDAILDPRNKGNVIEWLKNNHLKEVDYFSPINPANPGAGAFNSLWQDPTLNDYYQFKPLPCKGSFVFLKNLRKHRGFEQYFDDGQITTSAEDYFFGWDLNAKGIFTGWCYNIVLKELGGSDQGTWMRGGITRQEYEQKWKAIASERYGFRLEDGKLNKSKKLREWLIPKTVTVPKKSDGLFIF